MPHLSEHGRLRQISIAAAVGLSLAVTGCTTSRQHSAATVEQHAPTAPVAPQPTPTTNTAPGAEPALGATTLSVRLPTPLSRLGAVTVNHRILLAGGLLANQQTTSSVEVFDPRAMTISPAGHLPTPTHDAGSALLGDRAMIVGGGSASSTSTVQAVSPTGTASISGNLPVPRSDDAAASDGATLYVVGGYDGAHELPDILATTDGRTFRPVGRLAVTVRYAAAYADGSSLWIFGGEHNGQPTTDIQRFTRQTGQTSVAAHLPRPLAHEGVAVIGGHILLLGGTDGSHPQNTIYSFDPATGAVTVVGSLPEAVSDMGVSVVDQTAYIIGGEALTAEQTIAPTTAIVAVAYRDVTPAAQSTGSPNPPFDGHLLIADRGNNRLLLVDARGHIVWQFPAQGATASSFYFPDDAFFVDHGRAILSNQEGNNTIIEIAYPSGRTLWSYGKPGVAGSGAGFLHEPDDAYRLANGLTTVADANNCRVLVIGQDGRIVHQIGRTGDCVHRPPVSLGYPNGDTPLQDGNLLISEVNGSWISEYTLTGRLVWTVHLPLTYPSDPQQIGPDRYIVADYAKPGAIIEFDRAGRVLWEYRVTTGRGMLDHPSLAEVLPTGLICVNDDYRHRVVIIDPSSQQIVWQYGIDDTSGTAPGLLNTPDGFDLLGPGGTTPTHPWTG